jgi:lipopolysaccharide heptosyltransferase II
MTLSVSALNHLGHATRELLRSALLWRHKLFGWYLRSVIPPVIGQTPLLAPQEVEKILVIRLDEIGDFVLTTPFLRALRSHFGRARITVLVKRMVAELARACPYVDEVIELPRSRKVPPPFDQVAAYIRAKHFGRTCLRGRGFQYAISPRVDIDIMGALVMAYSAEIPYRIGYGEAGLPLRKVKNAGYDGFLTHHVEAQPGVHDVVSALRVAQFCGAHIEDPRLQLWPGEDSQAVADSLLVGFRQPGRRLIALAPGASLGRRRWPIAAFASLASRLIARFSAQIVVVGGREDVALGEALAGARMSEPGRILNLAGRLRLQETAALLGRCSVFVGNDSGPMHMAAAMGVPCVEVSCHPVKADPAGPNSPVRFSPWGVPHRVLQPLHGIPPCHDGCTKSYAHCIETVTTERVFCAVQELLSVAESPVGLLNEQPIL